MKKILYLSLVAGMMSVVSCGPTAEEIAAKEQAMADSLAAVEAAHQQAMEDSLAAVEAVKQQAMMDSLAAAKQKAMEDSIAMAKKGKKK